MDFMGDLIVIQTSTELYVTQEWKVGIWNSVSRD
jgi:hypothetical protein